MRKSIAIHQLQFIEEIIHHLTEHGAMPAQRLYASPFTDIHAQGPDGVFDGHKVAQIFSTLQPFDAPETPKIIAASA